MAAALGRVGEPASADRIGMTERRIALELSTEESLALHGDLIARASLYRGYADKAATNAICDHYLALAHMREGLIARIEHAAAGQATAASPQDTAPAATVAGGQHGGAA